MRLAQRLLRHLVKRIPGQLVIQFTDRCNARCPQCGMRVTESFPRTKLTVDEVKRSLDRAAEMGIRAVSFTGGEPLLHFDELIELIEHAGSVGIKHIRTGTNGFQLWRALGPNFHDAVARIADRLAGTPLRNLWISLDSAVPEVHEQMRGFPGIVGAIERALPIFHQRGIFPSANLGINRNIGGKETRPMLLEDPADEKGEQSALFAARYRAAFRRFYQRTVDMGFTTVNACYPMSMESLVDSGEMAAVYAATSADGIVRFSPREKSLLYATLVDVIPEYRNRIRIFSPLCSLYALAQDHVGCGNTSYPCRGGIDFFFVDSRDGNTYPCGYRGNQNLGKSWQFDRTAVDRTQQCRSCDWECFRDPSELVGPLVEAVVAPVRLLNRLRCDRSYFRLWLEDWQYYWACDFFDGRRPPDLGRLGRFALRDGITSDELIKI